MKIPDDTKIIVVEAEGTGLTDPLGGEKMAPVLAAYKYSTLAEGVDIARENLAKDGKGHSVAFHSDSEEHIEYVAKELCVSRFVINQTSANSAGGSFYNGLAPVSYTHLDVYKRQGQSCCGMEERKLRGESI